MIRWTQLKLRLRIRPLAAFAIPWLLATVFSFVYLSYIQRVTGESNARSHLSIVSDMLAFSVGAGLNEGDFSLVQKAFDWSRLDENVVYIGILDDEGSVVFQTTSAPPMPLDSLIHQPPGITTTDAGLLSIATIEVPNKQLGRVILLYSLEGMERRIRSGQAMTMVVGLLVLLLGWWGTRLLRRQTAELETARAEAESQARTVREQADVLKRMNTSLEEINAALQLNQAHLGIAMTVARMSPWEIDVSSRTLIVANQLLDMIGEHTTRPGRLLSHILRADREKTFATFREAVETLEPLAVEFRILLKNGDIGWIASYGRAMKAVDGVPTRVVGITMDITDRKRSESELLTSLKEKEILLKEVHHRVKNNMQVISSLLSLQSSHARDAYDVELFHESQLRVKAMALIHERLYRSGDLSSIQLGDYVETIVSELLASYQRPALRFTTSVANVRFGIDTAIPCGLLINELVTNAIKHAFPDGREGQIEISATVVEGKLHLSVSDDGIGLPNGMDFSSEETLGITIIQALTDQLDGVLTVGRGPGTRIAITFPLGEETYIRQ